MVMTKLQANILEVFTGKITKLFTIRQIARILKKYPSQVHRAIKPLIKQNILKRGEQNHLSLNYREHHETLAYVEHLRKEKLNKALYRDLAMFMEEVIKKTKEHSFVLILFGSAVESSKPRDIDVVLIVDHINKVEFNEKFLYNIASHYDLPFEERVISFESVYEMLGKREQKNLMNEILNKHIILYGAELFYLLITRGRT